MRSRPGACPVEAGFHRKARLCLAALRAEEERMSAFESVLGSGMAPLEGDIF